MKSLVAIALVVAAVLAGTAAAATHKQKAPIFFQTPSKNIGCIYMPKLVDSPHPYLRCDIGSGLRPLPKRPKSCDLDWGYGYTMRATGKAKTFCAGDTALNPGGHVLKYGTIWTKGPFTCASSRKGLRCTNSSRHGFFLSREHSYTF